MNNLFSDFAARAPPQCPTSEGFLFLNTVLEAARLDGWMILPSLSCATE
jgi:hypothetical protein